MNKLLIVIPYCGNDAALAERNLDHIYKLKGKKANGHALLVVSPDVHEEQRIKVRVTAELAFESVMETVAPTVDPKLANNKFYQMNNLFRHAAATAQSHYRWPWLWLEPDCVPVNVNWIYLLATEHEANPKKYTGMISGDKKFMARCGIYYAGASHELRALCEGDAPFAIATASKVVPSATHTELIQYLKIETVDDLKKISDKAVIVHGDKLGIFSENWEQIKKDLENMADAIDRMRSPETLVMPDGLADAIGRLNSPMPNIDGVGSPIKSPTNGDGKSHETPVETPPREVVVTKEVLEGLGEVTMLQSNPPPRLSRRQQRELKAAAAKV